MSSQQQFRTPGRRLQLVKWSFRIIFLSIAVNSLVRHTEYRHALRTARPIHYTVSGTAISSGRGRSYSLEVQYRGRAYVLSATSRMPDSLASNRLPRLFHLPGRDEVYRHWQLKVSGRLFVLFSALFLFTFMPFSRFVRDR